MPWDLFQCPYQKISVTLWFTVLLPCYLITVTFTRLSLCQVVKNFHGLVYTLDTPLLPFYRKETKAGQGAKTDHRADSHLEP